MDDFSILAKQLQKRRNLLGSKVQGVSSSLLEDKIAQDSSYRKFISDIDSIESNSKCPPLDLRFKQYEDSNTMSVNSHDLEESCISE